MNRAFRKNQAEVTVHCSFKLAVNKGKKCSGEQCTSFIQVSVKIVGDICQINPQSSEY